MSKPGIGVIVCAVISCNEPSVVERRPYDWAEATTRPLALAYENVRAVGLTPSVSSRESRLTILDARDERAVQASVVGSGEAEGVAFVVARDDAGNYYLSRTVVGESEAAATAKWLPFDGSAEIATARAIDPQSVAILFQPGDGWPFEALAIAPTHQAVLVFNKVKREGSIEIEGQAVQFAFVGERGAPFEWLVLDIDGDHRLLMGVSGETFPNRAPYLISLNGAAYEWSADPDWGRLRMRQVPPGEAVTMNRAWPGNSAPEFSVVDVAGAWTSSIDHQGHVLLLYFWATWCGPCRPVTQELLALHEEFSTRGLDILGVSKETGDEILQYTAQNRVPWNQIGGEELVDLYEITSFPTLVLVDPRGVVVGRTTRVAEIRAHVERLLSDSAGQQSGKE